MNIFAIYFCFQTFETSPSKHAYILVPETIDQGAQTMENQAAPTITIPESPGMLQINDEETSTVDSIFSQHSEAEIQDISLDIPDWCREAYDSCDDVAVQTDLSFADLAETIEYGRILSLLNNLAEAINVLSTEVKELKRLIKK